MAEMGAKVSHCVSNQSVGNRDIMIHTQRLRRKTGGYMDDWKELGTGQNK